MLPDKQIREAIEDLPKGFTGRLLQTQDYPESGYYCHMFELALVARGSRLWEMCEALGVEPETPGRHPDTLLDSPRGILR